MLVVDAANVVGSRPNGWWRDRAGAAAKLCQGLIDAVAAGRLDPPVVVVLEGAAKRGYDERDHGDVRVVHASGSGDDKIVEVVADAAGDEQPVTVVTADRELRGTGSASRRRGGGSDMAARPALAARRKNLVRDAAACAVIFE